MKLETKQQKRYKRHRRIRANLKGTSERPRFCVFRTPKHIYAQLIDDEKGKTILSSSDVEIGKLKINPPAGRQKSKPHLKSQELRKEKKDIVRTTKVAVAYEIGKLTAEKAIEKKIKKVVFDRGGYKYHGRVKAVAEGAREGGLKF